MALITILKTARPPFLLLVGSCMALPLFYASASGQPWSTTMLLLIIAAATCAHISVNMLNEYRDFVSRLDFATQKTPFSGGSGALLEEPHHCRSVLMVSWLFVAATIVSGLAVLVLQAEQRWLLLLLGLAGTAIVLMYTPWINRSPWLCLVAPGLGFGLVMSFGSYVALTGQADAGMLFFSVIPMLQVNNLLLLNQFPDREADAAHGRRHVVVTRGYRFAANVFGLQWLIIGLCIIGMTLSGMLGNNGWLLLMLLFPAAWVYRKAYGYSPGCEDFSKAMGVNVMMTLALPVLLGMVLYLRAG